jgi:glycosyltransferase involved in cell wall biosynthesis
VIFVNRFYWPDSSATAQILTSLAEGLAVEGMKVEVLTSRMNYADRKVVYPSRESHHGVYIRRLWSTRFGRGGVLGRLSDYLTVYAAFFFWLLLRGRRGDVVVLKTDPPMLSVLGAVVGLVRPLKLVAWCQDVFPEVAMAEIRMAAPLRILMRLLQRLRDWSFARCQRLVVLGEDMRSYLEGRGVAADKLLTIGNWAVCEAEATAEAVAAMREEWGIGSHTFVMGYSGNLGRAHDWQTLFGAAQRLQGREALLFLVCGGGHGYEQLRASVDSAGLAERFLFLPYQPKERLAAALAVPDVHWFSLKARLRHFIFPSKLYGILQAGKASAFIGRSDGEIGRLMGEIQCGAAFEEGDVEGLSQWIEQQLSDSERAKAAGKHAREYWRQNLRGDTAISRWKTALQQAAADGQTPGHL